jgi:hypothetical protein
MAVLVETAKSGLSRLAAVYRHLFAVATMQSYRDNPFDDRARGRDHMQDPFNVRLVVSPSTRSLNFETELLLL